MASRDPQRKLKADPRLTRELRTTATICAEVMTKNEEVITEALTDPMTRKEMKQLVNDFASLLETML